ncbi:MAG TPA: hypothetical protein VFW95_07735 [Candidatus Limnocylindria bacterium]|nr:hypothetical protein [Candidatus Limnocylindria bacterium]
MQETDPRPPVTAPPDVERADLVREAFHELHGRRLHGFGLLLTLGDRRGASRLAGEALAAGADRAGHLRHPERAAAWLRARVVRNAGGAGVARDHVGDDRAALADLGADGPVIAGLAALDRTERAAVIASSIERLDTRDVATIVGREAGSLERLLSGARRRYAAAYEAAAIDDPPLNGPLAVRLHEIAMRAMG